MMYEIKPNDQFKSLEIYFTEKPEAATRDALKALRFRWNPKKSCWYGFADLVTLSETLENATGQRPTENAVVIPEASFVDGGGLYDGWEGGNHNNWSSTKELKELLKATFKKVGLKVTIKEKSSNYHTSLSFTMTISRSRDVESFERFIEKYGRDYSKMFPFYSMNYCAEDGTVKSIHHDIWTKLCNTNNEEAEKYFQAHLKYQYDHEIHHGAGWRGDLDALTDEANKKLQLLKDIVNSFNRDCSNGMIDYFDRDFYDSYYFKVVD